VQETGHYNGGRRWTGRTFVCGGLSSRPLEVDFLPLRLAAELPDRSNVAIQNAGTGEDGDVTLRLTIFSNDSGTVVVQPLPDQTLSPGEFRQFSGILISHGLNFKSGYVKIERISGNAPYYAYGVINDQINSDGSFIPPVPQAEMAGEAALTLPVVVENSAFSTELARQPWADSHSSCRAVCQRFRVQRVQRSE
jgi:hypothetical protein